MASITQLVVHLGRRDQPDPLAHIAIAVGLVRLLHQHLHQRANALVTTSGTPAAWRVDDEHVDFAAVVRRVFVLGNLGEGRTL